MDIHINKKQAQKILNHFRAEKPTRGVVLLARLVDGECHEIPLESGAKIRGNNHNFSLCSFTERGEDVADALNLIGKTTPISSAISVTETQDANTESVVGSTASVATANYCC